MLLPLLALASSPHGLITRHAALAAGVDDPALRRLVATGVLHRLRRGVYVEADRWEDLEVHRERPLLRIRAAQLVLRCKDYAFSHDSASIAHGMGSPDTQRAQVHLTRRKVHGDADRAGIKHHLAPYDDAQVVEVEGLKVLDRARTALDMAREHGLVTGVACCDAALRLGTDRAELEVARKAMWCWPGSTMMDACLDLADAGAESWLESVGRMLVTGLGIGRPQTQFGLTDGRRRVWCDLRVGRHVFEVDGRVKYTDPAADAADERPRDVLWDEKQRQDFITGFKLGVSRITAQDCGPGRRAAERRLRREYADTCARFGTDISDLAPYIIRTPRRL